MLNINDINLHSIINVQAYKHDGELYKQWTGAKVVTLRENIVIIALINSKVVKENRNKYVTREPLIWIFDKNKNWNTSITIRKGQPYFYINIASMPIFEEGTLKYIDYDLDVKNYPGKEVQIVDQSEFEANKVKYDYSDKLVNIIEETAKEVLDAIATNSYPFDNEKIVMGSST